jgi:predicted DNA-binding transcriptional regulator AlpA
MTAPKRTAGPGALMKACEVKTFVPCSQTSLWRWVKAGQFPAPRILPGGHRRWVRAEVEAWAAALPKGTP